MKLLAFDTSSKALSVAILEDETLLAETTLTIKKNHSITLMPVIDFLMQQIDLTPKELDRIVVAEGPGSYTGLRIAVATAKTLAHTLGIELVGVSSLLALVPDDLEGLVVPVERAATSEQVTFVGEVAAFKDQIASSLPSATCSETLPDAVKIGRLGLKQVPASLHDFVPNYLKRVEAEENWLKDHTETTTSYIKRL